MGSVLENLGVNLAYVFIISLTFGIAMPWAVAFKQRWIVKNTIIDGRHLTFDGTGGQLFLNWIKWFLLTLITLGIYGFWVSVKMQNWIASHTHLA